MSRFSLASAAINHLFSGLNLPSEGAKAEHDAESTARTRTVTREIMVEEYKVMIV
jgi:hypothetical protein